MTISLDYSIEPVLQKKINITVLTSGLLAEYMQASLELMEVFGSS